METEGVLIDQLIQYGINVTYLTDEEYDAFADAVPNTWAMCQKTMGDDAWNSLLAAVAAAEAKAG